VLLLFLYVQNEIFSMDKSSLVLGLKSSVPRQIMKFVFYFYFYRTRILGWAFTKEGKIVSGLSIITLTYFVLIYGMESSLAKIVLIRLQGNSEKSYFRSNSYHRRLWEMNLKSHMRSRSKEVYFFCYLLNENFRN